MRSGTIPDSDVSRTDGSRPSQARRRAETRARIVAAAVACVDQHGFSKATFQRVAREAGVTVGAVQHYFASKTEVLSAVLEDSFQHLTRCFADVPVERLPDLPLGERISIFVDRAWLHFSSPTYRSTIQILLANRSDAGESDRHWSDSPLIESTAQAREFWESIFPDLAISGEEHLKMLRFVFSALSGIAIMDRLAPNPDGLEAQLAHLKVLVRAGFENVAEKGG